VSRCCRKNDKLGNAAERWAKRYARLKASKPDRDTVYVKEIRYVPAVTKPEQPFHTEIGFKADSTKRKAVEKGNITVGIQKKDNVVAFNHLQPNSIPTTNYYDPAKFIGNWRMDSTGRVEFDDASIRKQKRKKTLREGKLVVIGTGIGAAIVVILKQVIKQKDEKD
jgi:hypothetical protein